jgi:hypothetical protein
MDWKDEATKVAPGVIGSLVALRWIGGTRWQMFGSFMGGGALSYYGTGHLVEWAGTNPGLSGFLLGLFGMAVVHRVFEFIASLSLDAILRAIARRFGP